MKVINRNIQTLSYLALCICILMLIGGSVHGSSDQANNNGANTNNVSLKADPITVVAGESTIIKAPWPTVRVAVTDPKFANVQILTPDQILLQGINVGSTDLILWSEDESKIWQSKIYTGCRHNRRAVFR